MNGMNPLGIPVITGNAYGERPNGVKAGANTGKSFGEMLSHTLTSNQSGQVTFSKHAQTRTEQRGISLSSQDMNRLDCAVDKAMDKGLTDTLVFMNNTAFIVNVPNKVVVTVMDGHEADGTVFTNIDGAVIV